MGTVDVLIVGAGFGGCYLLHLLREQGLQVKVFEATGDLGGVWSQNRYPGARVDCELPYYGYSDPKIWRTWSWTERYPNHVELRKYFRHVDSLWDLTKDISFNVRVTAASWDDTNHRWTVKMSDGTSWECTWFLAATGTSFKPHTPEWKGMDLFKGAIHHSAKWPEDLVMSGKSVAVIGAGASGVQIMQEAGKLASRVTHFIRTPNLTAPMRQRKVSMEEIIHHRSEYAHVFKACRTTRTGLPIEGNGRSTFDDSAEQREAVFEEQWQRGGFNWY